MLKFMFNKIYKIYITIYTKILSCTTIFIIDKMDNKIMRMISEGSIDTEVWSNDAENSGLITGINDILKYTGIVNSYFKLE